MAKELTKEKGAAAKWKSLAFRVLNAQRREYTLAELKDEFIAFVEYYSTNTVSLVQHTKQKKKHKGDNEASGVELYGERFERLAPMTEHAFCLWLGRCRSWFPTTIANLKKRLEDGTAYDDDQEFLDFMLGVQTFLSTQVLEGAILGEYQTGLVASLLGLKSNVDVTSGGERTAAPIINLVEDTNSRQDYDQSQN